VRRDALTANGKVRLEWLPPLRRMTRCARELERAAAAASGRPVPENVRNTATGGVAQWHAARDLVRLLRYPQPLLNERATLTPDELTEVLQEFAADLETRVRLVRRWLATPESASPRPAVRTPPTLS
jgi:hypothetical protein